MITTLSAEAAADTAVVHVAYVRRAAQMVVKEADIENNWRFIMDRGWNRETSGLGVFTEKYLDSFGILLMACQ